MDGLRKGGVNAIPDVSDLTDRRMHVRPARLIRAATMSGSQTRMTPSPSAPGAELSGR